MISALSIYLDMCVTTAPGATSVNSYSSPSRAGGAPTNTDQATATQSSAAQTDRKHRE
jgi:hypothetical protein